MFKSSKKDLKEPVTLGDFVEFADFVADNVAMKDDLKSVESKLEKKYEDRFQIPLTLAFLLLIIELFINEKKRLK